MRRRQPSLPSRSAESARRASRLTAAILLLASACDNPIEPEDHPEAGGVVILDAGTGAVLATSISGGDNAVFDGPLTLSVSEVLEVEVLFLDAEDPDDLDLAFLPDEDEGESLRVDPTNDAIVEYHDHGDHGDFEAVAAGQTTVRFYLMHGGHDDFESGPLTVIVQ